jgi:hypothetical protein
MLTTHWPRRPPRVIMDFRNSHSPLAQALMYEPRIHPRSAIATSTTKPIELESVLFTLRDNVSAA